jgi:hypothetical protein
MTVLLSSVKLVSVAGNKEQESGVSMPVLGSGKEDGDDSVRPVDLVVDLMADLVVDLMDAIFVFCLWRI